MAGCDSETVSQIQATVDQAAMLVCQLIPEYIIPAEICVDAIRMGCNGTEAVETEPGDHGEPGKGGKWGSC